MPKDLDLVFGSRENNKGNVNNKGLRHSNTGLSYRGSLKKGGSITYSSSNQRRSLSHDRGIGIDLYSGGGDNKYSSKGGSSTNIRGNNTPKSYRQRKLTIKKKAVVLEPLL